MTAYLTVDLGHGDAGKGSIVDYLARVVKKPCLVVRYNGGAQAAHNVVTPEGLHHTFAQFGSGTIAEAETFLSRFMVVSPENFINEHEHLRKIVGGLRPVYVDRDAIIATPFHRMANRAKETARGDKRHGSCGQGIGEAMMDAAQGIAVKVGDIESDDLRDKLRTITILKLPYWHPEGRDVDAAIDNIISVYRDFARRVNIVDRDWLRWNGVDQDLIFEGAQGFHLHPEYGTFPFVTYSDTTLNNADTLLEEMSYALPTKRIGITRPYACRHGAGPLRTETTELEIDGDHNAENPWQGALRFGWFDSEATSFAANVCKIDSLALTCLDHVEGKTWRYDNENIHQPWEGTIVDKISELIGGRHVVIASRGPTHRDKIKSADLIGGV